MNELPNDTSSGYEGICPKCKAVIKTNIQGNELGTHICGPREELKKKIEDAGKKYAESISLSAEESSSLDLEFDNEFNAETWVIGAMSPEAAEYHTHNLRIEMVAKCAKMISEFKSTGEYRKGFADGADKALKEISSIVHTDAEVRTIALEFFFYWYNAPGNNTEQGFDDWWKNRNLPKTEKDVPTS